MKENLSKILFSIKTEETQKSMSVYHNILIEAADDKSGIYARGGGGGVSIYLADSYLCLDADIESKRVGGFGGFCVLSEIPHSNIVRPKEYTDIILYVDSDIEFARGIGYRMEFPYKELYDPQNKTLQFGEYNPDKVSYRFLQNAYCQIENGKLQGIIITGIKF